jgi:hypothetical protein
MPTSFAIAVFADFGWARIEVMKPSDNIELQVFTKYARPGALFAGSSRFGFELSNDES